MKISPVARAQWKQLCAKSSYCSINNREIDFKIIRAVILGKVTYNYQNGCKIYRYFDLNIMADDKFIMMAWRDKKTKKVMIDSTRKKHFDKRFKELYMKGSKPRGVTTPPKVIQEVRELESSVI